MDEHKVTITIPNSLWPDVEHLAQSYASLETLFIAIISEAVTRQQAQAAHKRIVARRQAIQARAGVHPSAAEWLRDLRQGEV